MGLGCRDLQKCWRKSWNQFCPSICCLLVRSALTSCLTVPEPHSRLMNTKCCCGGRVLDILAGKTCRWEVDRAIWWSFQFLWLNRHKWIFCIASVLMFPRFFIKPCQIALLCLATLTWRSSCPSFSHWKAGTRKLIQWPSLHHVFVTAR